MLRKIATARALDRLRYRLREEGRVERRPGWDALTSSAAEPSRQAEVGEQVGLMRERLAQLPPRESEVFCLRYLEELSYEEIAEQLGIRRNAVGVLLHKARRRLRTLFGLSDTEAKS